ncbi:MAG: hypothetical protein KC652_04985, partial [Cyanobacteria bacterium HKST-UBA01]|nr:hypothetical protein [Cyanobacteria bacterium HKST-UBA01]
MDILSSTIESSELIDDELELEEDLSVEELLQNSSDDISRTFNSPGGTSSVGSLMQCAGKLRALSAREEKEIIKCAQEGDKRSRNFIVMANLKMVASLARRYRNRGLPMVDLMQEGIIGLLNA